MRVPRVRFTVRRLIGAILIVALILALVIQSERAARLERELAASRELTRKLHHELRDAREILAEWQVLANELSPELKARAEESLNGRTRERQPPKGRSSGAERVPIGRGRDRLEPRSPETAK
jgi:hypothetical protein